MNGKKAEILSGLYLKLKGYKILDRNYHSRFGEIDIVAKKSDVIVFVEVKARGKNALYQPSYAVDLYKQKKIIKTAYFYISQNGFLDVDIRFDVIELTLKGMLLKINHITNAFGE